MLPNYIYVARIFLCTCNKHELGSAVIWMNTFTDKHLVHIS